MRCIPRDLKVIQNRQKTIEYLCHPAQFETTKQIKEALPKIRSISKYLKKLTGNQISVQDWKALKGTLVNMLLLGQVCSHNAAMNPDAPEIVRKIGESVLGESVLAGLVMNFERVLDVEASEDTQRFTVKSGFDEILGTIHITQSVEIAEFFLPLRFYVKSILKILVVQNLPF